MPAPRSDSVWVLLERKPSGRARQDWHLGLRKDPSLTLEALSRALSGRRVKRGLIFHSDRGVEYAAYAYRTRLAALGIVQSMRIDYENVAA